tara:strand:+ start:454 stop:765 length:312 start_codon:yes stop_codon:yes gene_type:complete
MPSKSETETAKLKRLLAAEKRKKAVETAKLKRLMAMEKAKKQGSSPEGRPKRRVNPRAKAPAPRGRVAPPIARSPRPRGRVAPPIARAPRRPAPGRRVPMRRR